MFIFIISVIVVSFICYCFFKKKFWENRYLVLTISAGVALVVTLGTNYFTRGKHDTKIETIWKNPVQVMSLNDSLIDSTAFTIDKELSFKDHLYSEDTTKIPTYSRHLFYYNSDGELRIGFAQDNNLKSKSWKQVYIVSSKNDTVAYYTKVRLEYNPKPNNWIADFSLPNIKTIKCLYLPPDEYAMIPDSLIREIPFKI